MASDDAADQRTPLLAGAADKERRDTFDSSPGPPDRTHWFKKSSPAQIYFIVSVIIVIPAISLYILATHNLDTAFIVAGIFGLFTTAFALNHFRLLFGLKQEISHYEQSIRALNFERNQLQRDVHALSRGHEALRETSGDLKQSNLAMMDMNRKFETFNETLQKLNVDSLSTMSTFQRKMGRQKDKYYQISLRQQRQYLLTIFERLKVNRIDAENYKEFYELLPKEYQFRLDRLGGFERLLEMFPGDKRTNIGLEAFEKMLDVVAQMHVENSDIEFKIIKKKSRFNEVEHEVKIIRKEECKGFYLTKEDVWNAAKENSQSASPDPLDDEPMLGKRRGINH